MASLAVRADTAPRGFMRAPLLRTGLLVGLGIVLEIAACGSDDGKKRSPGDSYDGAGEHSGGTDAGGDGGKSNAPVGGKSPLITAGGAGAGATDMGGAAGDGTTPPAEAGQAGEGTVPGASGAAGAAGAAGAGGTPDSGPRECPVGTADCDDDHGDCETNTASDATNCGRCERVCGGTAACTTGLCDAQQILNPTGNSNFCDWAFSDSTAYMLTCWGGFTEIRRTPVAPGAAITGTQLITHSVPVTSARGMLIDGNDVLYGLQGTPSRLYKFPLDADGPEDVTVAYTFENDVRFDGIQLIGDNFYWDHNTHTAAGQIQPGSIKMRAKTGTSSTTLVTGLGLNYNLKVFDSYMVWLEKRTTNDVLSVYRAPIAGANVADVELVTAVAAGGYLARGGAYAYWTYKAANGSGRISRLLVDDPLAKVEHVATALDLPEGIITDASYVYFKQADSLYRVPLAGGTAERLSTVTAADDSQATALFYVDDTYVYFAAGSSAGSSVVVRVAK
jgi:hypothetical protein